MEKDLQILINIKKLYYEYILSDNKKYLNEMFMLYIDNGTSSDYLEKLNNLVDDYDLFLDIIYFSAFLMNFNLKYEYYITTYENIFLDILRIDNTDDIKNYFEYKKKYINVYVEQNL